MIGSRPISHWLIGLTVLTLMPLAIVSLGVFARFALAQRAVGEQQLIDTTRALALATESHVQGAMRRLIRLAESEALLRRDFGEFTADIQTSIAHGEFVELGLFSAAGRLLVAQPTLARQAMLFSDVIERVVVTRQPYISDFVMSPMTGRPGVVLAVPVSENENDVTHVLIGMPDLTRDLLALMRQQRLPEKIGGGAIMDRRGFYIARTLNPETAVGHQASAAYRSRALAAPEGIVRNVNPEGQTVYGTFVHTSFGWITAIGVPASYIEAPFERSLAVLGALWVGGLVLCLGAAIIGGRHISAGLKGLAHAATETGIGHIPASRAEAIAEVDLVRRALVDAAERREELLREQTEARRAADAANQAKDEFLAMLSHELRNPLGAIASASGVLKLGAQAPAADRARAVIDRQVRHLSRLIDDLLDVGRLTSGKVRLNRQPLDLGELVTGAMNEWRIAGRFARHQVTARVSSVWIDADEARIEQVLDNLIGNALKFTPAGGSVSVRLTQEHDAAVLQVIDTGAGIPENLGDKIFDLFVQGERSLDRAQGGLGIGLTLVKTLAGLHGGTVAATSEGAGHGSVFTLRIPSISPPADSPATGTSPTTAVKRRRILIVEDNQDAREILRIQLTLAGHDVHEAADGPSAVEAVASRAPDVALIDVGLPGFDGYEVARRIRAKVGKSILLIAVSGYARPEDRERGLAAGFDAYLSKPVSPEHLAETLGGAM